MHAASSRVLGVMRDITTGPSPSRGAFDAVPRRPECGIVIPEEVCWVDLIRIGCGELEGHIPVRRQELFGSVSSAVVFRSMHLRPDVVSPALLSMCMI